LNFVNTFNNPVSATNQVIPLTAEYKGPAMRKAPVIAQNSMRFFNGERDISFMHQARTTTKKSEQKLIFFFLD
jgi:hypothetical protein